jgi:hypothetical protein
LHTFIWNQAIKGFVWRHHLHNCEWICYSKSIKKTSVFPFLSMQNWIELDVGQNRITLRRAAFFYFDFFFISFSPFFSSFISNKKYLKKNKRSINHSYVRHLCVTLSLVYHHHISLRNLLHNLINNPIFHVLVIISRQP